MIPAQKKKENCVKKKEILKLYWGGNQPQYQLSQKYYNGDAITSLREQFHG